ncbi:hypothetical protein GCM10029964_048210 [Kibdelosporangium lantanae]
MTFLSDEVWQGRVFTGSWVPAAGGEQAVREPATGRELGRIGLAAPEDVAASGTVAAEAQRSWAATPAQERAAVLRRAGDLWRTYAAEIGEWLTRESGSVAGKVGFELHVAEQECHEAAALPGRPYGEIVPSEAPRLSTVQRVPAGVVGVIAPFNAPLILAIRSVAPALALGNAVILKPDPRTAVCGGFALAAVFEEAGLPPGVLHVLPGGPGRAPRSSPTRTCGSSRSPDPPRRGGWWARPPAGTSSARTWNSAGTRHSSCWTTPTSTGRWARARGARSSTRDRSA